MISQICRLVNLYYADDVVITSTQNMQECARQLESDLSTYRYIKQILIIAS